MTVPSPRTDIAKRGYLPLHARRSARPSACGTMPYHHTVRATRYRFPDLRTLLARATPARSGDALAGSAAASERVTGQPALADLPLTTFLKEAFAPYAADDVTRLILDAHDAAAFAPVADHAAAWDTVH